MQADTGTALHLVLSEFLRTDRAITYQEEGDVFSLTLAAVELEANVADDQPPEGRKVLMSAASPTTLTGKVLSLFPVGQRRTAPELHGLIAEAGFTHSLAQVEKCLANFVQRGTIRGVGRVPHPSEEGREIRAFEINSARE